MNEQFNLCESCEKEFASCKGKPVFMSDVSPECPPPQNDAVIDCPNYIFILLV